MDTRILRLRLSRTLRYRRGAEGDDAIEVYSIDHAMTEDEEGPPARAPRPPPSFTGGLDPAAADPSGSADPERTGPAPGGTDFTLGSGPCAIAQFEGNADPESCLDAYLRDAWWAGIELHGPLILRRIREDGKEVFQWISPARFPPSR